MHGEVDTHGYPRSTRDVSDGTEASRSFFKSSDFDCPPRSKRDGRIDSRRCSAGQTRTKIVTIEDYDFSLRSISVFVGDTIEFSLSSTVPGHVEHVLEGRCASRPELDFVSEVLQVSYNSCDMQLICRTSDIFMQRCVLNYLYFDIS
jgi:hypothetical protein